MAKLYFKFGTMNASKTANALMTRYDYLQKNMNVLLLKSILDNRKDKNKVSSRIGLSAPCRAFSQSENLFDIFSIENERQKIDVVIVDECQFCTREQVDNLREVAESVPVICYGLKTNFRTELFEGSKRLLEIADDISEIKSVCRCGKKAILNGRFNDGLLTLEGEELKIGGNETYRGLCHACFKKEVNRTKIHNSILKYIDIFDSMQSFGVWSDETPADNLIVQKPRFFYAPEVIAFMEEVKKFHVPYPKDLLHVSDSLKDLQKIAVRGKSFEAIITLLQYVIKIETQKPGLFNALLESGTIKKWLQQLKKATDEK